MAADFVGEVAFEPGGPAGVGARRLVFEDGDGLPGGDGAGAELEDAGGGGQHDVDCRRHEQQDIYLAQAYQGAPQAAAVHTAGLTGSVGMFVAHAAAQAPGGEGVDGYHCRAEGDGGEGWADDGGERRGQCRRKGFQKIYLRFHFIQKVSCASN